jgi:hypothetical protein
MSKKIILALAALALVAGPALAQNRFMDEAKVNAARRDDNKSVREAEHPADPAPTQTAAAPAAPAAAAPAAAAPAAAAPATPAPAAPAAAPATPPPAQ